MPRPGVCRAVAREQYERLTLPWHFRTVEELIAPLEREGSPVRGAFAVACAEALEVSTPFGVELRRGGDVAAYAAAFTGFLRPSPSRSCGRPSANPTGKAGQLRDSMSAWGPGCWPSRSATCGATSWWPPC